MTIQERINLYCTWAIAVAHDDLHGYSQVKRWSPDYDCSSLVISALEQAGFPMRKNGASYTGNMMTGLLNCGFELIMDRTLRVGDILLTHTDERQHTAIYIGNNKIVHARGSNGHPESGDQTGLEICISNYYPFEMTFRYPCKTESEVVNMELEQVQKGSIGRCVETMQILLNHYAGYYLETDGIAGDLTINALRHYQRSKNLLPDGICGVKTWSMLLKGV